MHTTKSDGEPAILH